jgi:hypothetical protein
MGKRIVIIQSLIVMMFFCVCKSSCQTKQNWYTSNDTIYINEDFLDSLTKEQCKQLYIDTGNDIFYPTNLTPEQQFIYHFIQFNKYHSSYGFFNYYTFGLHFAYSGDKGLLFDSLDVDTRKLVLDWIFIAAKAGNIRGEEILIEMRNTGNGIPKDIRVDEIIKISDFNTEDTYLDRYQLLKVTVIKSEKAKESETQDNTKVSICEAPISESVSDQKLICKYGNVEAYNRVKNLYKSHDIEREIMFYSIVMANRYHYEPAYLDIYMCLWQAFNGGKKAEIWDMTRFDPKSRDFAVHYLQEAAKLGDNTAKTILANSFMGGI